MIRKILIPNISNIIFHLSLFRNVVSQRSITQLSTHSSGNGLKTFKLITRDELIKHIESPDTKMKSLIKLALAFIYCSISLLITAFVMVLVHDRVPGWSF